MTTEVDRLIDFIRDQAARRTAEFEVCLTFRFLGEHYPSETLESVFLSDLGDFMTRLGYSVRYEGNSFHRAVFGQFTLEREPTDYATQNELAELKIRYLMATGSC